MEGKDSERQGFTDFLNIVGIDYAGYLEQVFKWCREASFPYPIYPEKVLDNSFKSLITSDPSVLNPKARFGEKIILNFHPSIYKARKYGKKSPYEAWQDDTLLQNAIENRLIYKGNNLDRSKVLAGLSVSGIAPRVSIFNPYVARYICSTYLQIFDQVFDPCSGYSGRMLGVCSLGKQYLGYDVNEVTVAESQHIIDYFGLDAKLYVKDSLKNKGKFDCLFTCTPYLNKENWGMSIPQLCCDEWIDKFLNNYDCKRYVFVVDETVKYRDCIKEQIINKSHFSTNVEYIVVIDRANIEARERGRFVPGNT